MERIARGDAIGIEELLADRDALAQSILREGGLLPFEQRHLSAGLSEQTPGQQRPMTLVEKIVARRTLATPITSADPKPGEGAFVRTDWRFIHEYYTGMAAHMLYRSLGEPRALYQPERILVFEDHTSYIDQSPAHLRAGLVPNMRAMIQAQRDFAQRHGLRTHCTLTDAEAALGVSQGGCVIQVFV